VKPQSNRAWLLVLPALAVMGFVGVLPLVAVLNYSFHDIFSLSDVHWVGVEWYAEIVSSARFHGSLARSLVFSALVIAIQIPLGVGVAMLLRRSGRLGVAMMMLLAAPLVVPWNMIPIMWLNLVDPPAGLIGGAFEALGIGFDRKFDPLHTWILILVMDCWHWLGLVVILAYAGLSAIPDAYYRAAAIDGASRLDVLRHIEIPKIAGALGIVLLLRFVDSFMIYTEAFAINAGGPDRATHFLAIDLGEDIKGFSYGTSAARSMVYFLIVITVVWVFARIMAGRQAERGAGS